MSPSIPKTMKAVVIDRFGGPGVLRTARIPVPELDAHEVLIRVRAAAIGVWDPWLRGGGSSIGSFPQVLGTDGAGVVAARGSGVRRFKVGDRVYGIAYDNPKGGFYAEYAAIPADSTAEIPANLSMAEAGALAASGLTAIEGLDRLKIRKGLTLLITGASGGVGHVALQLAKRLGARILAVASRRDGVDLARRLGAEEAISGRAADLGKAAKDFAPKGIDAALVFANSERLMEALKQVRRGGAIAYPNGVEPEPGGLRGVKIHAFDGLPTRRAFERLNRLIASSPFHVEISRTYRLEEVAQAHRDVLTHHIGKLGLTIRS